MPTEIHSTASRGLIVLAFAIIYVVWGSTYLGIRIAIETVPPFLMAGTRFLLAGTILYLYLRLKGTAAPSAGEWRIGVLAGILMVAIANGGVTWAEQKVPSGLASLLVAVTPFWIALFDWIRPGGIRPRVQTVLGLVVGFLGVAWLIGSKNLLNGHALDPWGVAVVLCSSLSWSAGSIYTRYTPKPATPLYSVTMQMLAGGGLLILVAWLSGEFGRVNWSGISTRSWIAFFYLVVFGSLIAYSAYNWLLRVSSPARIATYAYINPAIALFLGWALAGEPMTVRLIVASAIIILGVGIITSQNPPRQTVGSERGTQTGWTPLPLARRFLPQRPEDGL